jgi:hypothetical protein
MNPRNWTFGKILLAYTVVEYILRLRQLDLENRAEWESGISNCRFWVHQPVETFLFPAALILILNRRHLLPYALAPAGLALYWATFDLNLVVQFEIGMWRECGRLLPDIFSLSDWGLRSFLRLLAALLTVGFCILGLWRSRSILGGRVELVRDFEPVTNAKIELVKKAVLVFAILLAFSVLGDSVRTAQRVQELARQPVGEIHSVSPLLIWGPDVFWLLSASLLLFVPKAWALFLAEVGGLFLVNPIGFRLFDLFRYCLSLRYTRHFDWESFREKILLEPDGILVFARLAAAVFILAYASGEFSRFLKHSLKEDGQ